MQHVPAVDQRPVSDGMHRVAVVLGSAVLVAAIHASYQFVVAPRYGYMGLTYESPDLPIYAVMVLLLLGIAALLPARLLRPADFLVWMLYVVVVIPALTISYLARTVSDQTQLMLGFVVAGCFALAVVISRASSEWKPWRLPALPVRVFWILVCLFSACTYLLLAATGSLTLSLPGLGQVYAARSAFADTASSHRLLAYLVPNQSAVINPMLMAIGIGRRKPWLVVAGIVGNLLLYGVAGNKSVLFSIPAVLIAAYLFRGGRRPGGGVVAWGVAAFVLGGAVLDLLLRTPLVTGLVTRRVMDVPGFLTGAWVATFLDQPKAHFAYSFLSPFLTYPYPVTPPFVVSQNVFGVPTVNANANLFADGFANFGWLGMLFETLVLIVILVVANASRHRIPLASAVMVLVVPGFSMTNSSVLTSLLTHGVALTLLIVLFAPTSVWWREPEPAIDQGAVGTAGASDRLPAPGPSWWQRAKQSAGPPAPATSQGG
jgi:hypothetical protein